MQDDDNLKDKGSGLSRRSFLKVSGISLSVPLVMGYRVVKVRGADVKVFGPGKVPIQLTSHELRCLMRCVINWTLPEPSEYAIARLAELAR